MTSPSVIVWQKQNEMPLCFVVVKVNCFVIEFTCWQFVLFIYFSLIWKDGSDSFGIGSVLNGSVFNFCDLFLEFVSDLIICTKLVKDVIWLSPGTAQKGVV